MDDLSALRRACELQPNEDAPRQALADCLDESGEWAQRSTVLRAGCAIRRQVSGILPPDRFPAFATRSEGWGMVGEQLAQMAEHPADTEAFRARYHRLVQGDVPLDPEHLAQTLRLQYDLQVGLLTSLNLVEADEDERFLTAIDGKRYPLPSFADVLARMQTPEIRTRLTQGFDTLLLIPFGLPLERMLDAWREELRRNAATLRSVGQFEANNPLWVSEEYRTQPLAYEPRSFTADHGGRTKAELLTEKGRSWDVLLVEGGVRNLPRGGQGQTVGRRSQLECGRSSEQYLPELQRRAEIGLTPEAYVIAFLDALERKGQVLDTETFSFLSGAFLPTSRHVPSAYWYPEYGQAFLNRDDPGYRFATKGVRAAVRVR